MTKLDIGGLQTREVDEIALGRAVDGRRPERLTYGERREAVRILTARRYSARQIAERLDVAPRTVTRIRAQLKAKP